MTMIPMRQNVGWIKGAEQTGPMSFRLMLQAPFPPALEFLASLLLKGAAGFLFRRREGAAGWEGLTVHKQYRITGFYARCLDGCGGHR